jgi:hypothetical protein
MFVWYELFLDSDGELRVTGLKTNQDFFNAKLARSLKKEDLLEIARKSGTYLDGEFTINQLVEILTNMTREYEEGEENSYNGG